MSKQIQLTRGKSTTVDDDDFEHLSHLKWYALKKGIHFYAERTTGKGINRKRISMHRIIVKAPAGTLVDHINGNSLDNRKTNLRICTHAENLRNRPAQKNNTSGYKGVCFDKSRNKWMASIHILGTQIHLGRYDNPRDAAIAYDKASVKYFGAFAKTNF